MTERTPRLPFSQRHPFLFGFTLILAAMILMLGTMVAFRVLVGGQELFPPTERFALVRVEGLITDSREITDYIGRIRRDPTVKGVVVRINSPGGVVAPSQEIFRAVQELAREKPVVASMASVAASGGYYVAAAAPVVVANPGTLTGSIGVILETANLKGLMEKLGVSHEQIVSGPFKGAGSPFSDLTEEQRDYLRALVENIHEQFVDDMAAARSMPREKMAVLARGQAFTGLQARDNGLVDRLGGLDTAFELLKEQTGLSGEVPLIEGPPEKRVGLLRQLLSELMVEGMGRLVLR